MFPGVDDTGYESCWMIVRVLFCASQMYELGCDTYFWIPDVDEPPSPSSFLLSDVIHIQY